MDHKAIYIFIILTLFSCSTKKQYDLYENPDNLFPIGINGQWGYVDSNGDIKIDKIFEETRLFEHGLAVAKYRNKYGYIDESGDWIIKPKFDKAGDFYFGCAQVFLKGEKIYITRKGKINDKCELWNFVTGCLVPSPPVDPYVYSIKKENKYALTYRNLKDTTEYIYDSVQKFNKEFILISKDEKWGFHYIYNNRPQWEAVKIRELIYDEVKATYHLWNNEIEDGTIAYAEVKKSDRWGLISALSLQEIITPKYYSMDRDKNKNYILVEYEPDSFGYVDYKGNEYFKR